MIIIIWPPIDGDMKWAIKHLSCCLTNASVDEISDPQKIAIIEKCGTENIGIEK